MRRWVGIVGGVILVAFALGAAGRPASAAATYTDADGRFSFTAPEGYAQRYRAGTDVSYRSLAAPTATLDVAVVAHSPAVLPSPEALAADILMGLRPPAYVGVSPVEPVVIGGQPGRRFDYYTVLEGSPTRMRTLQVAAVSSRIAVVLVFAATETDYPTMVAETGVALTTFAFLSAGRGAIGAGSVTAGSTTAGEGVPVGGGGVAGVATPVPAVALPAPTAPPFVAPPTPPTTMNGTGESPTFPPTPPPVVAPATTATPASFAAPLPLAPVASPAAAGGARRLGDG